jgi:hypothetical protein
METVTPNLSARELELLRLSIALSHESRARGRSAFAQALS